MILLCSLPSRSLSSICENRPAMVAPPILTVMPLLHDENSGDATTHFREVLQQ